MGFVKSYKQNKLNGNNSNDINNFSKKVIIPNNGDDSNLNSLLTIKTNNNLSKKVIPGTKYMTII
jgi:hypothetical protein